MSDSLRRNLPSAAEGLVQRDEIRQNGLIGLSKRILGLQQRALGIEHVEKIDEPLAVLLAGDVD
jgi:hypothetical protein